jgi:hypothetical protein
MRKVMIKAKMKNFVDEELARWMHRDRVVLCAIVAMVDF